jgi:hypothetical protein
MSSDKLNMEELFGSQFGEFKVEPSPGMWSRIRTQLFWKEFFSFSVNSFNVYYSAVIAAAVIGGVVLVTNLPGEKDVVVPDGGIELTEQDAALSNGQPVNFYNYSKDADFFVWDFGDSEKSSQSDPVHYYGSPGEYDITLIWK